MTYQKMTLITGNGNYSLAEKIAKNLDKPLLNRECTRFPNGEIRVNLKQSVRGADIYLIQSTTTPNVNSHLMELWLLTRTLKESDAERVTAIIPFIGYTRQDKKKNGREPLSMKFIADTCNTAGIDRYVFVDLHNPAIEGFFAPKPTTNLTPKYILARELSTREDIQNYVFAAPDSGAVYKMREVADILKVPTAYVDKERNEELEVRAKCVVGEVKDKNILLIEDMIDTGGTIQQAVTAIKKEGAQKIIVYATHPLLNAQAIDRINNSAIDEIITTDTIPLSEEKKAKINKKLTILSWSDILSEKVIKPLYTCTEITTSLATLLPKK